MVMIMDADTNHKRTSCIVDGGKPFIPNDWEIESHRKAGVLRLVRIGGDLFVDGKKIRLYLSKKQKVGDVGGQDLWKELKNKSTLSACMLDHFCEHPDLIPDSWKTDEQGRTLYIYFWGTIYNRSDGYRYVRYLYWQNGKWSWDYSWLGICWSVNYPAAILVD